MRPRSVLPLGGRIRKVAVRRQPAAIFGRFTGQARQVVFHAAQEAQLLRHGYVGTEHLLLALLFDDEGLAAQALESLGLSLGEIRHQVTAITGQGERVPQGPTPFTPQAKRVLELALREALGLGTNSIGTEHVLLGLLRLERGIGARVLTGFGVGYDQVRERVAELAEQREQADQEVQQARQATPAELADTVRQLDQVRAQKEAALGAEDYEAARVARDRERELLAAKGRLERQLEAAPGSPDMLQAVLAENEQMHRELDRLRGLLRDHGIEPDGGAARTA